MSELKRSWVKVVGRPHIILEDRGDGTYTLWSPNVWGPVGTSGKLQEGVTVEPLRLKADFERAAALEKQMAKSLRSQEAWLCALSGGRIGGLNT